jgi:transposase
MRAPTKPRKDRKLSPEQVTRIRDLRVRDGMPYKKIAAKLGVSYSVARDICTYRIYKDIP